MKQYLTSAQAERKFLCEQDVILFLLYSPEALAPGLRIYGGEALSGLQFKCLGKKLDLLMEAPGNGLLAVEVKFYNGNEEALGQLLGYMAAIRRMNRFAGRELTGLLVCRRATEHLLLAAEDVGSVGVCEFTEEPVFNHILEPRKPVTIPE